MSHRWLTAVALGSVLCVATPAHADAPATFRFERAITPSGVGPQRLPVDVTLLSDAEPGGALSDLRLFDSSGRELGYLLVAPPSPEATWHDAEVLRGVEGRDESSFEADLGAALAVDRIRLSGVSAPFVKRVHLEGSADRQHWVTLAADETVFDLPGDGLRRLELAFTPGLYRYFHMTWDDHSSSRVRPGARVSARLRSDVVADTPLAAAVPFERRTSEPRTSRFRVRLPRCVFRL